MFFTYSTRTSSMTFANIRTRAQWRQLFFFLFFQRATFKFSFAWQMLTVTRAEAWRRQRSNFKIPSERASTFFFVKVTRLKAIRQTSWSSISHFPTFPHVRDFIPCMSTGRTLPRKYYAITVKFIPIFRSLGLFYGQYISYLYLFTWYLKWNTWIFFPTSSRFDKRTSQLPRKSIFIYCVVYVPCVQLLLAVNHRHFSIDLR